MERRTIRTSASNFHVREEDGQRRIEGYFAVFGTFYELWCGGRETIDPGAFTDTLGNDIRALINHDTTLVLGRNKAGTLELRVDDHGLWGSILINPDDQDAMNLYSRVQRGHVNQCSFGFEIQEEKYEEMSDGSILWTLLRVDLHEVSVCTFPAYEETAVAARKRDAETIHSRKMEAWRCQARAKLKGE